MVMIVGDRVIIRLDPIIYGEATADRWSGLRGVICKDEGFTAAHADYYRVRLDNPRPDLEATGTDDYLVAVRAGQFIPESITIEEHPW